MPDELSALIQGMIRERLRSKVPLVLETEGCSGQYVSARSHDKVCRCSLQTTIKGPPPRLDRLMTSRWPRALSS
eukprot:6341197-Prymnesium_polylepis.1